MCTRVPHVPWCPQRSEEGADSPGAEVTDGSKLAHECWELDMCALPEQQELLTMGPPLHPLTNSHMDVCGFHT